MYRVTGRDPRKRPLTVLERAVFRRMIEEWWEQEIEPRAMIGALGVRTE